MSSYITGTVEVLRGFDASGTFSRIASGGSVADGSGSTVWQGDAASGTKIRADRHDSHDQDLANGLSECLTRSGKGVPSVDIPWGGKKITNLQNPTPGSQDAATANYVDTMTGWTTHKDLTGTGVEGRLNFTGLTGVNGITWSNVNAAWVTRKANADNAHEKNRIVLNNTVNPGDTNFGDVMSIDVGDGQFNFPGVWDTRHNLIYDPAGNARTPAAGTGGLWRRTATALQAFANNLATTVAYGTAVLENYFTISYAGSVAAQFNKKASGQTVQLIGQMGGVARWIIELGSSNAEAADNSGSDFAIHGYNNAGGYAPGGVLTISRKTGQVSFPYGTTSLSNTGHVTTTGQYTSGQNFVSSTALAVLAATGAGQVALRPNGAASGTGQLVVGSTGDTTVNGEATVTGAGNGVSGGIGYKTRTAGTGGAFQSNRFNMQWIGGASGIHLWVDNVDLGQIAYVSDYRLKKDVAALPSQWDRVKQLRPISYTQADWGDLSKADDIERWGFIAHELQETLIDSAANGHKDEENVIQSPNPWTLIAALTAALQEAQVRIEALEAK